MYSSARSIRSLAVLGAATVLTLAGCGGSDAADTTTATTAMTMPSVTSPVTAASDAGSGSTTGSAATAAPGGTDATAAPADGNTITIADFAFSGVTEVPVGTTIIVTNTDTAPHTFTSDDGAFDSGSLRHDDTFEFTFDTAGEFAYHCNFHQSMMGTITVTG